MSIFKYFFYIVLWALSAVYQQVQAWTTIISRRSILELMQFVPIIDLSSSPSSSSGISSIANSIPYATIVADNGVSSAVKLRMPTMPENVDITDKVFMDVRVARTDGSTYVRDDLPDTFDNRVLFQQIKIGLYGKLVPNHVEKFLNYIEMPKTIDIEEMLDNPYPSYSRSTFPALDQETGLLMGGYIPSLRVKDVAGTTAMTYGNRVLPANLWTETTRMSSSDTKISHSTKGLLTHKNLDVLPNFGVTTRAQISLDATHTVFGQVLWDDETLQFFRDLEDIPTYTIDRPTGFDDFNTGSVATSVYNAQREFFRGAAKTLGDDRVSKLYDGKLLRRMDVLQVGRL